MLSKAISMNAGDSKSTIHAIPRNVDSVLIADTLNLIFIDYTPLD